MKGNTTERFIFDGGDGWRHATDIPASTGLERSIVARRLDDELEAVRLARVARDGHSRPTFPARLAAMARGHGATTRGPITSARRPTGDHTTPMAATGAVRGTMAATRPTGTGAGHSAGTARPACQG